MRHHVTAHRFNEILDNFLNSFSPSSSSLSFRLHKFQSVCYWSHTDDYGITAFSHARKSAVNSVDAPWNWIHRKANGGSPQQIMSIIFFVRSVFLFIFFLIFVFVLFRFFNYLQTVSVVVAHIIGKRVSRKLVTTICRRTIHQEGAALSAGGLYNYF